MFLTTFLLNRVGTSPLLPAFQGALFSVFFGTLLFAAAPSDENEPLLSSPVVAVPASVSASSFDRARLEQEFRTPPREFTVLPFWFWNDELSKEEIARQIASFEERGVYGFTIHPRIGLPLDCGWNSAKLLDFMRFALEEARKRGMFVLLYDDGMYPSGSSAGQVVAENPAFAARGFVKIDLKNGETERPANVDASWNYVGTFDGANGKKVAVFDAPSKGTIRGLHYVGDETKNPGETAPPAADLLNPNAVDAFIRLVYQRYFDEFEEFFRDGTVVGIFTDEPSILGRGGIRGVQPGNAASLPTINKYLGYDFTPYLPSLWEDSDLESPRRRVEYAKALTSALEETYYSRISNWCSARQTALAGHPAGSADVGVLRRFQIPGQDIVWRYIEPGEKAFDPTHSALAKVASSAAIHNGARRNLNELFGAYGHNLTYREMVWLVDWCVVRGQNMLLPHAFYYSVRGPRLEERPPDVGPNSPWWDDYRTFADRCARLCWLNTDSRLVAPTAILVDSDFATTRGTRALFESRLDFNYLEYRTLTDDATVDENGVCVKSAQYKTLILTPDSTVPKNAVATLERLAADGRVVRLTTDAPEIKGATLANNDGELVEFVRKNSGSDVRANPETTGIRARHIVKGDVDFYLLFNEVDAPIETELTFAVDGIESFWNPETGDVTSKEKAVPIAFKPFELKIVAVEKNAASESPNEQ